MLYWVLLCKYFLTQVQRHNLEQSEQTCIHFSCKSQMFLSVCSEFDFPDNGIAYFHYTEAIMGAIASQIATLTIIYSTVYSAADQRKHHSSTSLAFVWEIHRGPVNSTHKWPVTRKMFPFDDVIMYLCCQVNRGMCGMYWMMYLSIGQPSPQL